MKRELFDSVATAEVVEKSHRRRAVLTKDIPAVRLSREEKRQRVPVQQPNSMKRALPPKWSSGVLSNLRPSALCATSRLFM